MCLKDHDKLPSASIIIRSLNEENTLGHVLSSLRVQDIEPLDVIIVDSGSVDSTLEIASSWGAQAVSIPKEGFSYGHALNLGFSMAGGEVLISLSAHAIPRDTKWLSKLLRNFLKSNIVAASSRILPVAKHFQSILVGTRFLFRNRRVRNNPSLLWNTSAAYLKEIWKEIPFNEQLAGCEDRDWALRALSLGYEFIYEPESVIFHYHSESTSDFTRRLYNTLIVRIGLTFRNLLSIEHL